MQLKKRQIDAFKVKALTKFEDEMVLHVHEFFPNHYKAIGEKHLRTTVNHGLSRAKAYGLISVRNVCMYINSMLLLGSNFDVDLQYPWATEILTDKTISNPKLKIDRISDLTLNYISKVTGPRNIYIYKALLNITRNKDELFKKLMSSQVENSLVLFNEFYPSKLEIIGKESLREMAHIGQRAALRYGIRDEACQMVYIVFMYLMGSGFDKDPQFPWAVEILNSKSTGEIEKVKKLYYTAVEKLQNILSQYLP